MDEGSSETGVGAVVEGGWIWEKLGSFWFWRLSIYFESLFLLGLGNACVEKV